MRRTAMLLLAALALTLLTAMGDLGAPPAGKAPETPEDIRVRLTDRDGVVTELNRFSVNGRVVLDVNRGAARVSIPWREIRTFEAGAIAGDEMAVALTLKDGETLALKVRKRQVFYGETGYGVLQIRAGDVRRIEVLEP